MYICCKPIYLTTDSDFFYRLRNNFVSYSTLSEVIVQSSSIIVGSGNENFDSCQIELCTYTRTKKKKDEFDY